MEPRIPMVFAVGLWAASGLAVLTYTFIAFKETANGVESAGLAVAGATNPLVASAAVLAAESVDKPLNRGRFNQSPQVKTYDISPSELGFKK